MMIAADRPQEIPQALRQHASAAEIGRLLASRKGGAVEVAEVFLDRIAAQTSPVFLTVTRERALAEARAADERLAAGRALSPLDGVPMAWKDLVDMAGTRTTAASDLFREAPLAEVDAPAVRKAARAGMVTLGKVNLAEFAYSALGQNPHFGTPLNPNALQPHAPGGSSSGSGVAIAAGLAPAAIGSDTAGSVRIPASYCGVVGFKTSERQVSTDRCFALSRTQDTLGPLAHSVEDCALIYDVLTGQLDGRLDSAPLEQLSIIVPEGYVTEDLSPAVSSAFQASLVRLERAGVRIRYMAIPALEMAAVMLRDMGSIVAAEAFHEHRMIMDGDGAASMDQRVRARIEIGRAMSADNLVALQRQRARGMVLVREALDGAFLAMPTTPDTAPALSAFEGDDAAFKHHNLRANRNTSIGSFYDLPGLAIPNGRDATGLPTSFLLSAPSGADTQLLRAGLAAEAVIRRDIE
jgi:aspartyl-tRNA(Asn)/glutamyl-tRNA(Gln) amidotransferase subunit A